MFCCIKAKPAILRYSGHVIYTCTGVAVGVGSGVTWRAEGRPRAHLHADDPGSDRRHVGLRSYRRHSLARLRWIRVQGTCHQDQPRRGIQPWKRKLKQLD